MDNNNSSNGRNASQMPLSSKNYTVLDTVFPEYESNLNSSNDLTEFVFAKYKSDMNEVSIQTVAGSTLPLVELNIDGETQDYNPFEHRRVTHPTSDSETLIHLLKGSLGSGILAMPLAFMNSGLWFGLFATFAVGGICTYCVHILVKCAHILCHRAKIPTLGFADVTEVAFLAGPTPLHKYSRLARFLTNVFLILDLLGCCCVYVVFVATNIKQVVDHYYESDLNIRLCILCLLIPLIPINMIRNLKYLAPFSLVANVLIFVGMGITMFYILTDLPAISSRPAMNDISNMPTFFGTVIFALEGIGVVMSLENNMKNPKHFIGCPGVLNTGMSVVIFMYAMTGFLGYLKYGNDTKGSITLNLPVEDLLAQSVKLMIAIAIYLTYALQFYVPMEIIWKNFRHSFGDNKNVAEYILRIIIVTATVAIAAAIPNLGPFISLIGAVCLSMLGLILPAIIELITYWDNPGLGPLNWILWKDAFLIVFGLVGFVTGTYVSLKEMTE